MTAFLNSAARPFRWLRRRSRAGDGARLDAAAARGSDSQNPSEAEWRASQVANDHRTNIGQGTAGPF